MQRLGVRTEVIERALNHRGGHFRGIVGVYQVDPLEEEVRVALQKWGDHVEGLVSGKKPAKRQAVDPLGNSKRAGRRVDAEPALSEP
jgi:hypothetical protein